MRPVAVCEIAAMLAQQIDRLAPELLPDGRRMGQEWRCGGLDGGRGQSLGVHLSGSKAGVWSDFASGEAGDALDLVAAVRCGGNKRDAIRWARSWLGLDSSDRAALEQRRAASAVATQQRAQQAEADAARTVANAQRIWLAADSNVRSSPVAWYLAGRGIDLAELGRLPGALRYHPSLWHAPSEQHFPALVALITHGDGRPAGVHRTYLQIRPDRSVGKAPVEPNKMVLGSFAAAAIRIWRGASRRPWAEMPQGETVHITEGIEDALSVAIALPEARVCAAIALGNMGAVALPDACTVVVLWTQRDDSNQALLAADAAVRAHLAAGRTVRRVRIPKGFKDVNDMLRAEGNAPAHTGAA